MRVIRDFVDFIDDYEAFYSTSGDDWWPENRTYDVLSQAEQAPVTHYSGIIRQDEPKLQNAYVWISGLSILTTKLLETVQTNLPLRAIVRVIREDLDTALCKIENALRRWAQTGNATDERRVIYQTIDALFDTISKKRIPELELLAAACRESVPYPDPLAAEGQSASNGASKETITLAGFLEKYCGADWATVKRLKNNIKQACRDRKITLPNIANPWTSGKTKVFFVDDLKRCWPEWRIAVPVLPPLKPEGGQ
jgi:hypothetical protein